MPPKKQPISSAIMCESNVQSATDPVDSTVVNTVDSTVDKKQTKKRITVRKREKFSALVSEVHRINFSESKDVTWESIKQYVVEKKEYTEIDNEKECIRLFNVFLEEKGLGVGARATDFDINGADQENSSEGAGNVNTDASNGVGTVSKGKCLTENKVGEKKTPKTKGQKAPKTATGVSKKEALNQEHVILKLNIDEKSVEKIKTQTENFENNFYNYNPDTVVPKEPNPFDGKFDSFSSFPETLGHNRYGPSNVNDTDKEGNNAVGASVEMSAQHQQSGTSNPATSNSAVIGVNSMVSVVPGIHDTPTQVPPNKHIERNIVKKKDLISINSNVHNIMVMNPKIPGNNNLCCHWCCHPTGQTYFGIPIKYFENKFYTEGLYCSLECATASNFNSTTAKDEKWERYSLINMLAREIKYSNYVKPAPMKESLKMFGGYMDIDEFRSHCKSNNLTLMYKYPMVPVAQQIEEINDYYLDTTNISFIPLDMNKIGKLEQKLKLSKKRTMGKNTLDTTMNMVFLDDNAEKPSGSSPNETKSD